MLYNNYMIKIRKLNKKDDLKKIAEYFFYTDPYIFPYMFNNVNESREILSKLISAERGAFSYRNCLVAELNDQIIGVLLYFTADIDFNYDYSQISLMNKKYAYTIKHYILKLQSYVDEGETYIAMLFVEEQFRHHHVATNLIKYLFETSPNHNFKLHVLKSNIPALNAYLKLNFKIQSQVLGFNGEDMEKPEVYEMINILE